MPATPAARRRPTRLLWALLLSTPVLAPAVGSSAAAAPAETTSAPPPTVADAMSLMSVINTQTAPIRSRAQFDAYVRATRPADNPLRGLSADARRRFVASLDFAVIRQGGRPELADIEVELTLAQAWRLLSLIGVQHWVRYLPDIRVETDDDRLIDEWRRLVDRASED